ncbi:ribosome-associated ATPase/putative transporter RbbA [Lonepinella sp. BR2357]|uniref:ribosome-associated ATPase/putative transporter RbbA n=1 Tax=Lonepinella sp. BR2357 TaxID=3434549 RepID=UPI003F6E08DD
MTVAVSIQHLTHCYGDNEALKDVSLEITKGSTVGLVGPDGVGKSTLLSIIAGVKIIQQGSVQVLDCDMAKTAPRESALPRIAFMPQGLGKNLYPTLTIKENIEFHADLFGLSKKELGERTQRLLQATGLAPFGERAAGKLSGGMKQKLSLCCALVHSPDLLILDEPTTGVDPLSRRQFWALVDNLRAEMSEMTVIVATAYIDEAQGFEYLIAMDDGKILENDKTNAVLERYNTDSLEVAYVKMLPEDKRGSENGLVLPPFESDPNSPLAMQASDLTKKFGDFTSVNKVSFEIEKGEIFGFLGSNGCGKSTTMKMLTGLIEPTSGTAQLLGESIEAGSNAIKKRVGYMSQAFSLYEELTVRDNLELHAKLYELGRKSESAIKQTLEYFQLTEMADTLPSALPLGIRQRLQLACACLHSPEVLILDEPTSGVDPAARDMFWEMLIKLSREDKITIFVTTHFMNEAMYCDRLSLMHKGNVLALGTPQELIDEHHSTSLEEAFIQYLLIAEPDNTIEKADTNTKKVATEAKPVKKQNALMYFFLMTWAFAVREAKELARDKIRLMFAIFGPIVLLMATGWAISFDVGEMRFGVYDQDQSPESRALIQTFTGSGYFDLQATIHSRDDLNLVLKRAGVEVVVEIPSGFGRDLLNGRSPEVGFFIDGSLPANTSTVQGYVTSIMSQFNAQYATSTNSGGINIVPRMMYNPESKSVNAMVPSLMMMIMMMIPAMMTALGVVREREIGSIMNLYSSPAKVIQFLLGKQLPYILMGGVNYIILVGMAIFWFGVPVKGSLAVLSLGAMIFIWASTSFGLLISSLMKSQAAALFIVAIATMIPTMNFSGMMYPVSSMAWWAQILSNFFPASWFQSISAGTFTKGIPFEDLHNNFLVLLIFPLVYLMVASIKLKKQEA